MGTPRGRSPARGNGTAGGASAHSPGGESPARGSGGGGGGDLPRLLPRVSASGARKSESGAEAAPGRPAAGAYLRRSSTIGVGQREMGAPAAGTGRVATSNNGGVGGGSAAGGAQAEGGAFIVRRDRDTLQHEKMMLQANKRRLEALLRGVLDQQQQQQPLLEHVDGGGYQANSPTPSIQRTSSLRSSGNGAFLMGPGSAGVGLGSGNLRSQILKALDDSAGLDAQVTPAGAGSLFGGAAAAAGTDGNADARVQELSARVAQLQTEYDIAAARYEGELRYRNTQASAATSQLLRQLSELDAQADGLRRALAASEGRVADLTAQNTDLRHSNQDLAIALRDKSAALDEAATLMSPDAAALSASHDVLRSQLREANLALASRERRIHELERQAAARTKAVEEAQHTIRELRAHTGAGAAGAGIAGFGGRGGGGGDDILAAAAELGLARDEDGEGYGVAARGGAGGARASSGSSGWHQPMSPPRADFRSPAGAESPAGAVGAGASAGLGGACRTTNGPPALVLVTSFKKAGA
ncbi:hypothetical protein HXX76_013705 [Chlamydomonas incerta]|uniref:Uncharacterized protein n=1 Tax=Chlamydomonas incerta TaxID=51695 RepID=A0A835STB3_CHLIN|nr:hypothetical protein HXX76_013705 [Chlamydomonas incerta]|eukprot:KAG2425496.1 hypothetical protein HXX76_013705 [Chlamydomonas incerta]